jgi:hypothetical protein
MILNTDLLDGLPKMLAQPNPTDVLKARDLVGPVSYHSYQYINELNLKSIT